MKLIVLLTTLLVLSLCMLLFARDVKSPDDFTSINGVAFNSVISDDFTLDPEYAEGEDLHPYSRSKDTILYGQTVSEIWYLATPSKKMFGVESTFTTIKSFNGFHAYFESIFGSPVEFGYADGKVIFVWSGKDTYIELGWNDSMTDSGEGWVVIKKDYIFENEVYAGN